MSREVTIIKDEPPADWIWYGEDESGKHLSFGRSPKLACQKRYIIDGPELKNVVTCASILERSVANMRNPQTVAEAAVLVHVTVGPALKQAKEAIAAYKGKFGV